MCKMHQSNIAIVQKSKNYGRDENSLCVRTPTMRALEGCGIVVGRQVDDGEWSQAGRGNRGTGVPWGHPHFRFRPTWQTQNSRFLSRPQVPVNHDETAVGFQDGGDRTGKPCLFRYAMKGVGNQHPIHTVRHQPFEIVCIARFESAVVHAFGKGAASCKCQHRGIEINRSDMADHSSQWNCEEAVAAAEVNDLCCLRKTQPLQHFIRPRP